MIKSLARNRKQNGLTLIELMIAVTLGLLIVAGIASLFVSSKQSFGQDEKVSRLQEDGRFAMSELVRDIAHVGFWGQMLTPVGTTIDASLSPAGTDCPAGGTPWMYGMTNTLSMVDNATATTANSNYGCIASSEFFAGASGGTDIVAIKRVQGLPLAAASLTSGVVYLGTNGTIGTLFKYSGTIPGTVPASPVYYQHLPLVYFIRNYSVTAGDGIPTLCRKILQAGNMTSECIAPGVENLQLEYGIDTNVATFTPDGIANQYINNPTTAQLAEAVSVRISLLIRSPNPDPDYTNNKTYTLGNATAYTPNDHYYRRLFTTTVLLRNPTNCRAISGTC